MANHDGPWTPADVLALRERLGVSQAAFAVYFGVNQSTVHRWESEGPKSGVARVGLQRLKDDLERGAVTANDFVHVTGPLSPREPASSPAG